MTDTNILLIIVGLAIVAVAIVVSLVLARRAHQRTELLKQRFGPEYDRAVDDYGRGADAVLEARARRVDQIRFRELSDADRVRFSSGWTAIQAQFVDDPRSAVARANELIKEVMRARGYSADDGFAQRAEDLSVDHPDVVQHYRAARALASGAAQRGPMNTEELRQAFVHYRVLFADLLQPARPLHQVGGVAPHPAHA